MRTASAVLLLIAAAQASAAADAVRVEVCDAGIPTTDAWPYTPPTASETFAARAFGFFHVPHKYIDTGVRADRPLPYLVRATATVELPAGRHRLLLRGRGATRLTISGAEVLALPFPPPITDGHNPIPTDYLDLGPDFRFAPPGNRERWTHFTSQGGRHEVVLETLVGSKRKNGQMRPEVGETVVAWSPEGNTSWRLLAPEAVVPYTDAGWAEYATAERAALDRLEAERRAAAFVATAPYWERRREAARHWLAATPDVPVPPLPAGYPGHNAIDRFLAVRHVEAAKANPAGGTVDYVKQVQPLLEARCFSCHQGSKTRGGLRLDPLEFAKAGGDSGEPAILPGKPDKSLLLTRVCSTEPERVMPPKGDRLTDAEVALLRKWIAEGARFGSPVVKYTPLADDLTFLRRVTLDTVGVVPTEAEITAYLAEPAETRRDRAIDRLLADPRWGDHWVSYWQDVLAENPNILNPTLNNTGPFRWWLYESFRDNKPTDVLATELVSLRGSLPLGGPAGFGMASGNDVPLAEKGIIVASAFLGVQMKCARCHDAPGHRSTQRDLFEVAALLGQKAIPVPKTSSVPLDKIHTPGGRKPLIVVTLQPGTEVKPAWSQGALVSEDAVKHLYPPKPTARDRLGVLLTAPQNDRFAQVVANRLWARLMGRGIVEPVDDWEKGQPSHPELLRWLGREFVRLDYDLKALARVILRSHAYQRAADATRTEPDALFAAPARRRLTAEQIVDSLFLAAGKRLDTESVNLDVDGGRDIKNSLDLGKPRRAWQFASTSNERDRPSLMLPRVQAVVDVLEAFGWRSTRQDATSIRETAANALQPATVANSTVAGWLTRLSDDHGTTALALEDQPLEKLVDRLFLRILTRPARPEEKQALLEHLKVGYDLRRMSATPTPAERKPPRYVSWSNHLTPEANELKRELEAAARRGDPPTARLDPAWRERLEDAVWALLNAPEFVFTP